MTFLARFNGFGIVLGFIAPVVFALARRKYSVLLSLLSLLIFFIDYRFMTGNDQFKFVDPQMVQLPRAMAIGLANACDLARYNMLPGYLILFLLFAALIVQTQRAARGDVTGLVVFSMIAFTLLFMVLAAEGRIGG